MKNVLFVTEKWCDAHPEKGWTNSFHNFFSTFVKSQPQLKFNTLHLDESSLVFQQNIDEVLIKYCNNYSVDVIFYCLLGNSPFNPSATTYKTLKEKGIYQAILWPDTGPGWGVETIKSIGNLVNLNISIDFPVGKHINEYNVPENHLFLWTPEDDSLYFEQEDKDIDVSFLGSKVYFDRSQYLQALLAVFPSLYLGGGQREEALSPYKYAEIIRRTKIGLNFSLSPTMVFHQLKGRTLEYIASGSLLIENKNPATEQFFTPGEDFVQFSTFNDLVEKLFFYLENEAERTRISQNGLRKFRENWTAKHFWDIIIERIKQDQKQKF